MSALEENTTATDVCPAGRSDLRTVVENFLTAASWAEGRQEVGATGLTASDVQLLTDPEDTDMCQDLNEELPLAGDSELVQAYYRAGSFYFAPRVAEEEPSTSDLNLFGISLAIYEGNGLQPKALYIR